MWSFWRFGYFSPYSMLVGILLFVAFFFLITRMFSTRRSVENYTNTSSRVNSNHSTKEFSNLTLEERLNRGLISKEEYDVLKSTTPDQRQ